MVFIAREASMNAGKAVGTQSLHNGSGIEVDMIVRLIVCY